MRWLRRILVVLLVLVVAGAGFMLWTVRRSFPRVNGEIGVDGLHEPVTIHRDRWGIPHIMATSDHDLFFAQGFVHAQERFWQMDFWRHIGSGRDRKSTRLNSSHVKISYAVFCLKKKKQYT